MLFSSLATEASNFFHHQDRMYPHPPLFVNHVLFYPLQYPPSPYPQLGSPSITHLYSVFSLPIYVAPPLPSLRRRLGQGQIHPTESMAMVLPVPALVDYLTEEILLCLRPNDPRPRLRHPLL